MWCRVGQRVFLFGLAVYTALLVGSNRTVPTYMHML